MSWAYLGEFEAILTALESILGGLGGLLGSSWRVLGWSFDVDKLSWVGIRRNLNILPWVGGRGVGRPLYFPYGSTGDFEEIEC